MKTKVKYIEGGVSKEVVLKDNAEQVGFYQRVRREGLVVVRVKRL